MSAINQFQTPLENLYPSIFGELDEQQELLIRYGSMPLVIVENASEIVSQIKDLPDFMEQIIESIVENNDKSFKIFGSETFPAVIKEKWLYNYSAEYTEKYGKGKLTALYDKIIRKIKPKNCPKKAVLHMAIDLGSAGHYGVAIKNGEKVVVFDSMQTNGNSVYTPMFCQIAEDVFGLEPITLKSPTEITCPQFTGGFVYDREEDESKQSYLYRLQHIDSQNHFCYMWAIWYFHVFITKGEDGISTIFESLEQKKLHPLVVIKRYIWSIIHHFYPDDISYNELIGKVVYAAQGKRDYKTANFLAKYFLLNFRYVWHDLNSGIFNLYSTIDADVSKLRNNKINDCLNYSLELYKYKQECNY